ncbi:hypothetical protein FO131_07220 [Salmonella bongori]|uniref:Uncharacterized protein n=1 Tax=Salmonella bongori TaxID=54736 RepID=A0A8F8AV74_SALBN|nr:hypothetical protein [Salmonella bongori serovar 48:i:-]ECG9252351.1 hypothetical protein [Salmonella bongori]EGE4661043.1 hypothetical protein [Salmonella bongori serovar 48:i:- str. 94-0708]QXY83041.1 hypothetical protein EWI73_03180 [Salmonella bongori]QXY84060.1 hypothetical protein EWI73_08945 [Salmonella bongori]
MISVKKMVVKREYSVSHSNHAYYFVRYCVIGFVLPSTTMSVPSGYVFICTGGGLCVFKRTAFYS